MLNEFGISWLPRMIWNLDREYPLPRQESPCVKKHPSKYIHGHVKLSTESLETTAKGDGLIDFLDTVDGIEERLCFSSNYPRYTMDDLGFAARILRRRGTERSSSTARQRCSFGRTWRPSRACCAGAGSARSAK